MPIETIQIATNRYAPSGSEAIQMYDTGASGAITLGQLVQAVCIRSRNKTLEDLGTVLADLSKLQSQFKSDASGSALGIEESALPADLSSYDRRMQAATALKAKLDALVQDQQEQMIDLQTMVNRRDVAYSTSSNVVRALATSQSGNAQNF